MTLPTLSATALLIMPLACSLAWGKPPVKPQKGSTVVPHPAQQPGDETTSDFLQPPPFNMEIMKGNLAGQLSTPLPQYQCQYCANTYKSKGGLTNHKNKCISKPQTVLQNGPLSTLPVSPPSPDSASLDEELPLTLAECSRLVSAYTWHPEWQDFLDSGRHATTQTTAFNTRWNGLKLDTASAADKETPFPTLTPDALKTLMQLSPSIGRLNQQLKTGKDPLADKDDLKAFIKKASQNNNELFATGSHSLVIKWRKGPGYVLKIARSRQDSVRLTREQNLYLWLRNPDNILLNLTTTPMRAAFSVSGKPILALRQVDGTARGRLLLMREHHSLNERLDFALSVIFHFCQIYRRFLEKDVLLADRHDDNIGFNEIPLQGSRSVGLNDTILQVPVMLDLDPYWFGEQESREIQLDLPTWVPVVVGLLEEVFTPVNSDNQISRGRADVIDQIRKFASPVFISSSSSVHPEAEKADKETALRNCTNHWFQDINQKYSRLLAEARSHIELLLGNLNRWDSTPRTVAEWNKKLQEEMEQVLQWLNNWKNETRFPLLKDFTTEGIIRVPSTKGDISPGDQQILTLLSMIHGRLGCQKCSRTFPTNTVFRKHCQLHQLNKLQRCEFCKGDFTDRNRHQRIHTREKPYGCEQCGKGFSGVSGLKRHLRTHSGDKPHRCEQCGKCFSQAGTLVNHLRTHSGYKPYACEQCGKCFCQAVNLQNHLRTHSGDKPYKCEHCGKCFSQGSNLKRHLRTHFRGKPHICTCCGTGFSDSSNRDRHQKECCIKQP